MVLHENNFHLTKARTGGQLSPNDGSKRVAGIDETSAWSAKPD